MIVMHRYKDDAYDRMWTPREFPKTKKLSTSLPIRSGADDSYLPPSAVMSTAITPINGSHALQFLLGTQGSHSKILCLHVLCGS